MGGRSKAARDAFAAGAATARNRKLRLPDSVDNSKVIGDIDAEIAKRLRALRIKAGFSQTTLGQRAGVSYQQMQKYEHARDRIAASTIQRFANALGIPAGWFFERTQTPIGDVREIHESFKIASLVLNIKNQDLRKRTSELIAALSGEDIESKSVQKRIMALADCIAESQVMDQKT